MNELNTEIKQYDYAELSTTLENSSPIISVEIIGSGSQGEVYYDDIINAPILNIIGYSENPVLFSNLTPGRYVIKGYYRYNSKSEVFNTSDLFIEVYNDQLTNNRMIKFEQFENSIMYIVVIDYYQEDEFTEDRLVVSSSTEIETANNLKIISF